MDNYFLNQTEIYEAVKTLLTNFKKDGRDRKTTSYCQRKLDMLQSLWVDYQTNHRQMCEIGDFDHDYFRKGCYDTMHTLYSTVRDVMETCMRQQLEKLQPTEPEPQGPVRMVTPTPISKPEPEIGTSSRLNVNQQQEYALKPGATGKVEGMLKKQSINFKALKRTIGSMNVDRMQHKWEFEDALKTLQSRWSIIDSCHWEIEGESTEEDTGYQAEFSHYEMLFNDLKKAINTKMWSVSHREKSTPKMDIPIFSGNYHHWTSFKDLFSEAIHTNPSLSNAQKMQFLKGKVTGEAERLIHHLQISSDNYEVCWEILNHRYGNKKLIFTSHVNILLGIPNMQQQSLSMMKKLHDVTKETVYAIKNLGVDVTTWDPLLVHLLAQKLDSDSFAEYLESVEKPRELPVLQEFLNFLESKFTTLEASRRKQEPVNHKPSLQSNQNAYLNKKTINYPNQNSYNKYAYNSKHSSNNMKSMHVSRSQSCAMCNADHGLWACRKFLQLTNEQKLKMIHQWNYCKNCLICHFNKPCFSTKKCRTCLKGHNSLLHEALTKQRTNFNHSPEPSPATSHVSSNEISEILLATALVKVFGVDGTPYTMRALIDGGSQISLISEHSAQLLGLKRNQCRGKIFGIGEKENTCKGMINIKVQSMCNDFSLDTKVLIMNNLIKNLPNTAFTKPNWPHIQNINLADPDFNISRPVDLLLGAEIYSKIILEGVLRGNTDNQPIAQQTQLGWLLCGSISTSYRCNVVLQNTDDLRKFWETEEITDQESEISSENQECLDYFLTTTERLDNGRYQVRLPFKAKLKEKLGATKPVALAQFRALEKKLEKNPELKSEYQQFMDEYYSLDHMKLSTTKQATGCYLPHHPVIRSESLTTKLRVVFNASAKSSSMISLNDTMYTGPNLQQDLQGLILKWRQYRYVYTADIEKMYRQIMVHPEDQNYQKILWRHNYKANTNVPVENQPIKTYQLTTVTYGTKPAPFLAMMCLKQLAKDERSNYPDAAKCLEEQFYMDDYCGGGHFMTKTIQLRNQLIALLQSGGFHLRKWSANDPKLLEGLDQNQCNIKTFEFKQSNSTKTLGLGWNPQKDIFSFELKFDEKLSTKPTKRSLLADISRLFDPLGWLTPISTTMKILFQTVWLSQSGWDDILSPEITNKWLSLRNEINEINTIKIKRWLGLKECNQRVELHGFCDASNKAYASVIYCKVVNGNETSITLVMAKAKLAPLNKVISTPRLELMAAQLLSKVMTKVQSCLPDYHSVNIYCWTDSTAVLGWIQGDPGRWKTFVANRVRSITKTIPSNHWGHVKTNENPADCASRGFSVTQLKSHELWWSGPKWLLSDQYLTSKNTTTYDTLLEIKPCILTQVNVVINEKPTTNIIIELLHKYSSINKTIRIVAWIMRMCNRKRVHEPYLTLHELRRARMLIVKNVQHTMFCNDLVYLKQHNKVHCKSNILNLNPFIDQDGLLRVGGRLRHADLNFEMRHPLILPHKHRLTTLLIQEAHELTFHGGARITLANLRKRYWIIGGYTATKSMCRQCVICKKNDPIRQYQLMGDLPAPRVNPEKTFYHCGVDYTGFVEIKANKGRGIKTTKGYIALFICMVTKAVHIELVSDLTSSAFLAALTRMAARRGAPRHIYSDNGTNFIGADRMIQEEYDQLRQIFSNSFMTEVTEMGIEWHFNAPSWPNAGGLWERNIRSLKYHLKRVIGHQKMTFEEYATLLAKLEACLNTRPLCALTEDSNDLDFLTPAHFLTTRPGLTVIDTEKDARTRWHLTAKLFNDLWKRWKSEYLTQLSARSKWLGSRENLKIGDLVTIHDENLPAGKWAMGRVVETHPGDDGLVRVVTLRTKNGMMKRPIVKLSVLPINQTSSVPEPEEEPSFRDHEQTKRKRRRPIATTLGSIATALLFFMTLFVPSAHGLHTIHKLPTNQTLFYDPISKLQLIRDKWTVVTFYDMSPYWAGINAYNKINNYLSELCDTLQTQSPCHMIVSQLRHDDNELEYYNELLLKQHFNVYDRQRRRRGLINGVGYLANELFGVLDSRFAEQYTKDIETIRKNQKHVLNLWKNQTSVIESEFNLMKKMEINLNKQLKFFNNKMNTMQQNINNVQKEIYNISTIQDFTLAAMAGNNLLQNLKRLQDTLLDTITDVYHGRVSLHLLTPGQLKTELQTIQGQIANDLRLPVNNLESDLQYIYQLLNVKARVTQKFVIFEITFPLVSRELFRLYKIIPIPHQVNSDMITIVPISEYVAINFKKDMYFIVTINEVNTCLRQQDSYLCQLRKPIVTLENSEDFCVKNLPEKTCRVNKANCANQWIELHQMSQYLYFCCDIYSVKIICDDQISLSQLTQAGVVGMSQNCIVKGKEFVLNTIQHHSNQDSIVPDIYIPEIDQMNHIINIKIPVEEAPLHNDLNESFYQLQKQIRDLKSSQSVPEDEISYHDVHHYTISYILLVAILGGAFAWMWKSRRCAFCSRSAVQAREGPRRVSLRPPAPSPRVNNHHSSVSASASVSVSDPSRYQCAADPRQLSVSDKNKPNSAKVRLHNLAARWPSFRSEVNRDYASRDKTVFTIEDTVV